MILTPNGAFVYNDIYELMYELMNIIGLSIDNSGYIYDQDTSIRIEFQGRMIKCSIDPNNPCYAGQGEVMFDILGNVRLVTTLFGYCIDKETAMNPEFSSVSQFIEDEPSGLKMTSMSIKMADGSTRTTDFYYNKCLKFVHAIFLIYETLVDLHNFDTPEE